ncbi:MAG TPA: hypothetical protein VEJ89_03840 [Myxococcaceae bacterium]|jgi:hypothetical protein|nr:hypothetical protein [Myxococcaceae bacterium]
MTERKVGRDAVVADAVRVGLGASLALTLEEERVLRLLHGVSPDPLAPLAQVAPAGSELGDELLVLEMHLLRAVRARAAQAAGARGVADPVTKSKIVRALRKKR